MPDSSRDNQPGCRNWRRSTPIMPCGSGSGSAERSWGGRWGTGGRSWEARRAWRWWRCDHARRQLGCKGAAMSFELSPELTAGLKKLGRAEGATLYMTLLATLEALLGRWSGQQDFVVGSPIAGRRYRETEGLIGFFVNMLALRADLGGRPGFRELLGRVKEVALGADGRQDMPLE